MAEYRGFGYCITCGAPLKITKRIYTGTFDPTSGKPRYFYRHYCPNDPPVSTSFLLDFVKYFFHKAHSINVVRSVIFYDGEEENG